MSLVSHVIQLTLGLEGGRYSYKYIVCLFKKDKVLVYMYFIVHYVLCTFVVSCVFHRCSGSNLRDF